MPELNPLARAYADAVHDGAALAVLLACAPLVVATSLMGGRKPLPTTLTRSLGPKPVTGRKRGAKGHFLGLDRPPPSIRG